MFGDSSPLEREIGSKGGGGGNLKIGSGELVFELLATATS